MFVCACMHAVVLRWPQDVYIFTGFALLLQICLFLLSVVRFARHSLSTEEITVRVFNMFIAAMPTGAPTSKPTVDLGNAAADVSFVLLPLLKYSCCCCCHG